MRRYHVRPVILSLVLAAVAVLFTSCGGSDYRIFSLREGIAWFSMEYPQEYSVTRIDVRNSPSGRYTDIGLVRLPDADSPGLNEISVYAWPAGGDEPASVILDETITRADTIFSDFNLLDKFSVMIGDMEGQGVSFTWTAYPDDSSAEANPAPLPAVSKIVCFRHGDLAWEIHVASDIASQAQATDDFQHIVDTFQIIN
jgi:hypothetical protein